MRILILIIDIAYMEYIYVTFCVPYNNFIIAAAANRGIGSAHGQLCLHLYTGAYHEADSFGVLSCFAWYNLYEYTYIHIYSSSSSWLVVGPVLEMNRT